MIRFFKFQEMVNLRRDRFRSGYGGVLTGNDMLIAEGAAMRASGMGDEYRDDKRVRVFSACHIPRV